MADFANYYQQEVAPKLREEFGVKNNLALPTLEKIVINMGLAQALSAKEVIEKASQQLAQITGQKPKITRARKSIANFKLKQGDAIGAMVTLRGKRAWSFLEKLKTVVMPRMRDFRGLPTDKFDKMGNYSLGLSEQTLFPEVDYSKIDKLHGLVISLVIKSSTGEKSKRMLELLGLPFKQN